MTGGLLRFFFDHCGGGCLWAGCDATRAALGDGPVDGATFDLSGRETVPPRVPLSAEAAALRDTLDALHATMLNPVYPPDPSLWRQARCDRFNAGADRLVALLRAELEFTIEDRQERFAEDPRLADWLRDNPGYRALD